MLHAHRQKSGAVTALLAVVVLCAIPPAPRSCGLLKKCGKGAGKPPAAVSEKMKPVSQAAKPSSEALAPETAEVPSPDETNPPETAEVPAQSEAPAPVAAAEPESSTVLDSPGASGSSDGPHYLQGYVRHDEPASEHAEPHLPAAGHEPSAQDRIADFAGMATSIAAVGGAGFLTAETGGLGAPLLMATIGGGAGILGATVKHNIKNFGRRGPLTKEQLDEYQRDVALGTVFGAAGGVGEAALIGRAMQRLPPGLSHTAEQLAHRRIHLQAGATVKPIEKVGEKVTEEALHRERAGDARAH